MKNKCVGTVIQIRGFELFKGVILQDLGVLQEHVKNQWGPKSVRMGREYQRTACWTRLVEHSRTEISELVLTKLMCVLGFTFFLHLLQPYQGPDFPQRRTKKSDNAIGRIIGRISFHRMFFSPESPRFFMVKTMVLYWKTLYLMVKTHGFPVKKKSRENQSNDRRWKPTSGTQFSWGSCRNKMARARGFGASIFQGGYRTT